MGFETKTKKRKKTIIITISAYGFPMHGMNGFCLSTSSTCLFMSLDIIVAVGVAVVVSVWILMLNCVYVGVATSVPIFADETNQGNKNQQILSQTLWAFRWW